MDIKKEAYELLKKNRRETDGHQYTVPSPDTYPYQWLWDSCFHAIVLSKLDPEAAKAELRSLVSKQEPAYRANTPWLGSKDRPNASWRGPIWMLPHWCIYKGLKKYGMHKEAEIIKKKSITLIEKQGFREHFDPESGAGLGAKNFTWGALVLDMNED